MSALVDRSTHVRAQQLEKLVKDLRWDIDWSPSDRWLGQRVRTLHRRQLARLTASASSR